jgi:hypothetical protein
MDKVRIVLKETTAEVQNEIDRVCKKFNITTEDGIYYVGTFASLLSLNDALRRIKSFCQNIIEWTYFDEDDLEGDDIYLTFKSGGILNE